MTSTRSPSVPLVGDTGAPATLEISGVTVRFGGLVALDDVSLTAQAGTVHGVIGPNGAGKTTLFNVVCGFLSPDTGQLVWRGEVLTRHRPHRLAGLGIARTLQALGLFPHMPILDNVMAGATRHARAGLLSALLGLPFSANDEAALRARALATLAELGIADTAGRLPGSLPYPVQKRAALARALVTDPDLLLLDEPASGLSATEMDELGDLIVEMSGRRTVMLVEHHMDLVMRVCDRLTVLDFGRVIADGTPAEVQRDERVLEAYLGQPADDAARQADAEPPAGAGTSPTPSSQERR